jgi:hypothetical protein
VRTSGQLAPRASKNQNIQAERGDILETLLELGEQKSELEKGMRRKRGRESKRRHQELSH